MHDSPGILPALHARIEPVLLGRLGALLAVSVLGAALAALARVGKVIVLRHGRGGRRRLDLVTFVMHEAALILPARVAGIVHPALPLAVAVVAAALLAHGVFVGKIVEGRGGRRVPRVRPDAGLIELRSLNEVALAAGDEAAFAAVLVLVA